MIQTDVLSFVVLIQLGLCEQYVQSLSLTASGLDFLFTRALVHYDNNPIQNQAGALYSSVNNLQGLYSLRRRRLTSIGIPMINLRRSDDRLRFIMGIPILN